MSQISGGMRCYFAPRGRRPYNWHYDNFKGALLSEPNSWRIVGEGLKDVGTATHWVPIYFSFDHNGLLFMRLETIAWAIKNAKSHPGVSLTSENAFVSIQVLTDFVNENGYMLRSGSYLTVYN